MSAQNEKLSLDAHTFDTVMWAIADNVLTITLNRPKSKNAINLIMANELIYCLDFAKQECDIRVVVIAATGSIFCAGGDLKLMSGSAEESPSTVPSRGDSSDISRRIRGLYKPVIIKAQGHVLAGALLMACNATHVIASDNVAFAAPEIQRGLWPYMVMASLFRVIPRREGLDFIMRGYRIDAHKAQQWGLVNEVVTAEKLDQSVDALAAELASLAPATMQRGLEAFYMQEDLSVEDALPHLQAALMETIASDDAKEGITAFMEKRAPKWS